MSVCPAAELFEGGAHREPGFREVVGDAQRGARVDLAYDQAGYLEFGEPVGEHALADPGDRTTQVCEVSDHGPLPAPALVAALLDADEETWRAAVIDSSLDLQPHRGAR